MKIIEKKCSELIGAEYNPRQLTQKQHSDLKDSLTRFGMVDPVLINSNPERENIIIGGHQRKRVWEELGNKTIPCIELDLTIEQEKELNIRLNKNTGQFDSEILANFFDEDDLLNWGFEEFEFGMDKIDLVDVEDIDNTGSIDVKESEQKHSVTVTFENEEDKNQFKKEMIERGFLNE